MEKIAALIGRAARIAFGAWLVASAHAATPQETQHFLRAHRHAWLPYPFPFETSTAELGELLGCDFDVVDLSFAGGFHGGDMDFATLDQAVQLVASKGKTVVFTLTPRFDPTDGVFDQLSDGTIITNMPERSPNAAMIDIFDLAQREKFGQWIDLCVRRYGHDPRVSGFIIGWGYMGETGFFIGDYLRDFQRLGRVASGYSTNALREFNLWRRAHGLPAVRALPLPSIKGASDDYILFHRFRTEFSGDVFQAEAIARAQKLTKKPVGIFGYISVNGANYGRDWAFTPNADFLRSAVSTASFDLHRTLLDSGVGWEDHELHDGPWNFTLACLERDIARQIAHGAVFHAMPVRVYKTEPQWEHDFFPRLADFLIHQKLAEQVRETEPEIALFQPTWASAALPVRGPKNLFVPQEGFVNRDAKMVGLVESFGLPYRLITERDLLKPETLRHYQYVILPLADLMPRFLGHDLAARWNRDQRVIPIPSGTQVMSRTVFRHLLAQHHIQPRLDFASDQILAGRVNNLIFNWNDQTIDITIPEQAVAIHLQPSAYQFLTNNP